MNYSFFYAAGTAGYVRGEQMADALGGKKNPKDGYENDICIYVKVLPPENLPEYSFLPPENLPKYSFLPPENLPKHSYADVDDSVRLAEYLETHSELGVIATSNNTKEYLALRLKRDDIIVIPHAHCNYENWIRPDREVKTVGVIGSKTSFQGDTDEFSKRLKEIGLNFIYEKDYWKTYQNSREKVCDFYKQIDIQVCWRPKMYAQAFKNPNKLVNAGSFGIPTVAYPERGFDEWDGKFIQVDTIDDMVASCLELKELEEYYNYYAEQALKKAQENHISNIIKLYRRLK